MPRLPRPHIPLVVKCYVASRQLGHSRDATTASIEATSNKRKLLSGLLAQLAELLGCEPKDLRLDHDPALAIRHRVERDGRIVGYIPDANNPDFLIYRTKTEHHIKTNVRGDGAQFPDRVLIKRERRRRKGPQNGDKKRKWGSRPFPKTKRKIRSRGFRR